MSCREHGGGRLATALARDASGLSDVQVLTTLHRLNREAAVLPELPQPTREEVSRWAAQTVEEALAANPTMSKNRQRKLQQWAKQVAQEDLPSPTLFYAWQNLQKETRQSHSDLELVVKRLAHLLGTTPGDVRDRAAQFARQYTTSSKKDRRSLAEDRQLYHARLELINEMEYTLHQSGARDAHNSNQIKLPQDGASLYALGRLAVQLDKSQYLRQALREAPDGSIVENVTYIPVTDELAITFTNGYRHNVRNPEVPMVELLREVVGSSKVSVLGQFRPDQRPLAAPLLRELAQGQLVEKYEVRFGQGDDTPTINRDEVRVVLEYCRPAGIAAALPRNSSFIVDFGDGGNLVEVPSPYFNRRPGSGPGPGGDSTSNPTTSQLEDSEGANSGQPQTEWPRLVVEPNQRHLNHFALCRQLGRCAYCGQFTGQDQGQGQTHNCPYAPAVRVEPARCEATLDSPEMRLYTVTGYGSFSGVAYNPVNQTLDVEFSNRFYRYHEIPAPVVEELLTNPNPAYYHATNMRARYNPQEFSDFRQSLRAATLGTTPDPQTEPGAGAGNIPQTPLQSNSTITNATNPVTPDISTPENTASPASVEVEAATPPTSNAASSADPIPAQTNQARLRAAQVLQAATQAASQSQRQSRTRQPSTNTAQARQYAQDMQAFQTVYDAARARKDRGEPPVPFVTRNATGGLAARDGGRGFGIEIEFDVSGVEDRYEYRAVLKKIGQALYKAGITRSLEQMEYHAGAGAGDYSTWRFEEDGTVAGEIISPILYDESESWKQLAKVCKILKRYGAVATRRTGGHVHVGCADYDHNPVYHTRLLRAFAGNEDVIYRLAQNPAAERHRGFDYCGPVLVPCQGYASIEVVRAANSSRYAGLNFQAVEGTQSDHVEFRMWDGSLDPGVIQAQVNLSLGLTHYASAQGQGPAQEHEITPSTTTTSRSLAGAILAVPREEWFGAHKRATEGADGQPRQLTQAEWEANTRSFRELVDKLFKEQDNPKEQVTALFAVTNWQQRI